MNYHFLKNQLKRAPIVPMQQESFENILIMVEDCYQNNMKMNQVIDDFFSDTKQMYHDAMQKSVYQNILQTPNVKGLENDKIDAPKKDLE